MERKFACYTPSSYFDFRECRMHDNTCNPRCNLSPHCGEFYPPCTPNLPKPQPIKPPNNCFGCCQISPCVVWFISGMIASNIIRR